MNELEPASIADIQQAFFEYRAAFNEPITRFWYGGEAELISTMLKALSPWRLGLENISWNEDEKSLADERLTFAVPSLFASIQLGISGVTTTAANPDWSKVAQYISLFQTAAETAKAAAGRQFDSQQTTLAFHVLPTTKPFREKLVRFVDTKKLGAEGARMFGVSAYSTDFSFVIDGSTLFPDGVFIRLTRVFPPGSGFEEMAGTMFKDEERILHLLDLKLR
jgi:hypothetical protein